MKKILVAMQLIILSTTANATQAPLDLKEFLLNSTPANCAHIYLAECDNSHCYGEPEAFFFGIKGKGPGAIGHSFKDYNISNDSFNTQLSITEDDKLETLKMSLFREAWAPTYPDRDGRSFGVTKFEYTISKRKSDGKIIFAQEVESVRKFNIFGSLKKKWKINSTPLTCRDE